MSLIIDNENQLFDSIDDDKVCVAEILRNNNIDLNEFCQPDAIINSIIYHVVECKNSCCSIFDYADIIDPNIICEEASYCSGRILCFRDCVELDRREANDDFRYLYDEILISFNPFDKDKILYNLNKYKPLLITEILNKTEPDCILLSDVGIDDMFNI